MAPLQDTGQAGLSWPQGQCLGSQTKAARRETAAAPYREQPLLKEDFCCRMLSGRQNTFRSYEDFKALTCVIKGKLSDFSSKTLRSLSFYYSILMIN